MRVTISFVLTSDFFLFSQWQKNRAGNNVISRRRACTFSAMAASARRHFDFTKQSCNCLFHQLTPLHYQISQQKPIFYGSPKLPGFLNFKLITKVEVNVSQQNVRYCSATIICDERHISPRSENLQFSDENRLMRA